MLNEKIDKNYIYLLNNNKNNESKLEIKIYIKLNEDCANKLNEYKNKITPYFNNKLWDLLKKFTNPYEFIYSPNTPIDIGEDKRIYNSVVNIKPISRSYFKLWEILYDMNNKISKIFDKDKNIYSAHIAEGPGGFIECFADYTNQKYNYNKKLYGITLLSKNNKIPKWRFKKDYLIENNINLNYYKENDGNLYNINNIDYFINKIGCNKCNFCTADGGFDFSSNYNTQENDFILFLICEIYLILNLLKNEGNCVIKIYDTFNYNSIKILDILNKLFKNIYFIKPYTSRPANSEKYLFCYSFLLNNNEIFINNCLNNLRKIIILKDFKLLKKNVSDKLLSSISNYNIIYMKKQIEIINDTLNFIEKYNNLKISNNKNSNNKNLIDLLDNKYKTNLIKIEEWCKNYEMNYNLI
jgi:23S rRNA U2552 (ribose-2'-O)-methylase RlmE/FtsJ